MKDQLLSLIKEIQKSRKLVSLDEAATKQGVILKILNILGWDPFNTDEVYPEYSLGGKKVDYSLKANNNNKVFVEVKKAGEELDNHQEQLLGYSFHEGVKLAILTNGISWWFYLPLHEGSWEQRKFYTIEMYDQNDDEIAQKFIDFLSKDNVVTGKAITNAEKIFTSKQKKFLIKETIPTAWQKIISEPDELLIELIAETTEKLCGHKPDHSVVENFLSKHVIKEQINVETTKQKKSKKPIIDKKVPALKEDKSYTGKSLESFTFKGKTYEVKNWRDMLLKICNIMLAAHKEQFEKVLNLKGRKKPYFSDKPEVLRTPQKIKGTNIYVEVNLSAMSIVRLSRTIISLFGYNHDDLKVLVK